MKYEGSLLRGYTKQELCVICINEGIDVEGLSRAAMIKALMALGNEEVVEEPIEEPMVDEVFDRGVQIAYDRELARRMGGRVADNYETELARRRGAGTHLSGADAVAAEIARRRKMFGSK